MLLGEKVGPYIRPNPASFTRNLERDRIGKISWDETQELPVRQKAPPTGLLNKHKSSAVGSRLGIERAFSYPVHPALLV